MNIAALEASPLQINDFAKYSSFVPYASEQESLSYSKDKSSYVRMISQDWAHTTGTVNSEIVNLFKKDVFLQDGWRRQRVFLHVSKAEFSYQLMLNDSLVRDFHPLNSLPNEIDVTSSITINNRLQLSVVIPIEYLLKSEELLFREVYLYTVNEVHLTELNTSGYFIDGKPWIFVNIRKANYSSVPKRRYRYKISVYDETNQNRVTQYDGLTNENRGTYVDSLRPFENRYYSFGCQVYKALAWTAETPIRYRVTLQVKDGDGNTIEVFSMYVAFRNLKVTSSNIQLNRKTIKLKGIDNVMTAGKDSQTFIDLEKEVICLTRNNINAIKMAPNIYNADLFSLCDKYGLYVIAGVEPDARFNNQAVWLQNYYALLQNHPSVIGWYSRSLPHLKDSLEKINRVFNFWKDVVVLEDLADRRNPNTEQILLGDLPIDTISLKNILAQTLMNPIILESNTVPLEEPKNKKSAMIARSLNSPTGGLSGLIISLHDGDSLPVGLFKLYQPVGFEEVSRVNRTYTIVNRQNFATTDSIEFHYQFFIGEEIIFEGDLPVPSIKPGQATQVRLPNVQLDLSKGKSSLTITARRKEKYQGRSYVTIASENFEVK